MTKRPTLTVFTVLLLSLAYYSCNKDAPEPTPVENNDSTGGNDTPSINPTPITKEEAIKDYNDNYLGSKITGLGWNGSATLCDPGTITQAAQDAVIKRINYFRRMVGLNDDCTLDESLFKAQQETALMMHARNDLSHDPDQSWSCYTPDGAKGAKNSLLRLGSSASEAITAFMNDFESYNVDVGHRRWLLHSKQSEFSHGSTTNVGVVYVTGRAENTKIPDFIAYPPASFVPEPLVFNRWSFGIPNADFSGATVTMASEGKSISVTVVSKTTVVADNTIVWEPDGVTDKEQNYTVTIKNVKNAPKSSYTYEVKVFVP